MVNVQCQIQYQYVNQQLAVTQITGVLLEIDVVSSQTALRHVSRLLCHHPLHQMVSMKSKAHLTVVTHEIILPQYVQNRLMRYIYIEPKTLIIGCF